MKALPAWLPVSLPALLGALALLQAAPAALAEQRLVPAESEITFTSKQMGVPVEGRFKRFAAQVAFDPKQPETAKIAISVDLASASLGTAETEAELAKSDWFATQLHPQATFQSTSARANGPGRFEIAGKLAIKGVSRDVVVPVTLTPPGDANKPTTAAGSFTLKRLDYRIGEGDWKDTSMVADDVVVKFRLALTGAAGS